MSTVKAEQVWEAVLGQLQLQVTRPSYETWLSGTVGLSYLDGEFVVGTPNPFVSEMLEQRMYSLISQALQGVVDSSVELRFQVQSHGSPANGGRSSEAVGSHAQPASPLPGPPVGTNGGVKLNSRYTFENFIVGKSNELAHAAAQAVSMNPGITYNPLFIYSGVGLGKTHLLHAIGQTIMLKGLSLIYSTTEEFTNQYIKAIREGKTEEFRRHYRSADVLLLDDIQFIIGKEQTQEGFFHTFNALHMATRQIVITSDRPAESLTLLEDRVRSRLAGGLVVDIQHPDLETRQAILRSKSEETSHRFPPEVLLYLAERIHRNIRELEGSLNRVAAYAELTGDPITLDLVKSSLADVINPHRQRVSDQQVLEAVSAYFTIDKETLRGRRRDKQTALARQTAMYLLREEVNLPLATIGRLLGGKDHTTVLHACQRISSLLNSDDHLRRDVINIRDSLSKAHAPT